MNDLLRGAECRDLASDYVSAAEGDSPLPLEAYKAELRDAAVEQYGQDEWEHWLAWAERERAIWARVERDRQLAGQVHAGEQGARRCVCGRYYLTECFAASWACTKA